MTAHSRVRPSTTTPRSSAPTARRSRARPRRPAARTAGRRARTPARTATSRRRASATTARSATAPAAQLRYRVTRPRARRADRVDRGGRLRARASAPRAPSSPRRCATRRARWPRRWRRGASSRARRSSRCRATAGSQRSIDWGKQNLADLTLRASDLQIRWTNQGKQFPAAAGHGRERALVRRGLPGLPVDLRDRRRVHRVRRDGARPVPDRRGPPAHAARHLRRAQRPLRHRRARDGRRRLGLLRPRLATTNPTARRRTTSTPTRRSSSRASWR